MTSPLNNTPANNMNFDNGNGAILQNALDGKSDTGSSDNPLRWVIILVLLLAVSILAVFLMGYRPVKNMPAALTTGDPFLRRIAAASSETSSTELPIKTTIYGEKDKAKLVKAVNGYRADNGLKSVKIDKALQASAQAHAEDMFDRYYFSHTDPEGKTPYDRLNDTNWSKIGENIIQGNIINTLNVDNALQKWIESPPHKETLLNKDWTLTGVGVKQGTRINPKTQEEEPIVIWVQLFGVKR